MKIALIVNPLIPVPPEFYGGIERIVYMLIQGLIRNNHEVTLFASEDSRPGTHLVGYTEDIKYSYINFLDINLLTARIAFKGFDLVHTFGRMSNIALLMFSRLPKIVSYQLPPTISQVKKAVRIARKNSLFFTACSDYIGEQIRPYCDVTTIYNGIDITEYQYNCNVEPDAPLVFLGRIQEEKGTAIAIRVAKLAGRKLIIAGNVPAEPKHQLYFEEQVKPFIDQDHIIYIGPVNNYQKNELLGKAGALLMPVTWHEPFGIVMAEALACGTPVVGFAKGALPEIIIDGINGFINNSIEAMIGSVKKLSTIDRADCRKIAEQKFSAIIIADQYERLYKRITQQD